MEVVTAMNEKESEAHAIDDIQSAIQWIRDMDTSQANRAREHLRAAIAALRCKFEH